MTPTERAARVLADVPRFDLDPMPPIGTMDQEASGEWVRYADALAAIALHLAPGDDLVERLETKAAMIALGERITWGSDSAIMQEAASRIAALTATVAELEATVAEVTSDRAYIIGANAGWEAAVEQDQATPAAQAVLASAEAAELEAAGLRDRLAKDAKAHEKEVAVWSENYAALERRLARMEGALQRAVDGYGQKMRNATDKREKRDWQSMLIAAVDIQSVALTDGGKHE